MLLQEFLSRKKLSRKKLSIFGLKSWSCDRRYNSNSILKGLLRICSHEKDIKDKGRGRRGAMKKHTDEF